MIKNVIQGRPLLTILFLLSLLPLFDLLHPGLPVTHDGQDHVARIANFYQNLTDGVLVPRWAPNLNWGYGHPILMFLYPVSSYTASFFHFLGFSFVDSLKLLFAVSFIASGFTMYLWVKEHVSREAGFVAALLYLYAPYRFVDLYVRGAIGEHVAFIFPPLVLYFLLKLAKHQSQRYLFLGSLSFAGLILSHNAISLIFLPIIFLYILFLFFQTKSRKVFAFFASLLILFGFGLAAFFWVPAFFEGKYTLRDIVSKGAYFSNFQDIGRFFYSEWSYGGTGVFSVQIGIVQWFVVFLSAISLPFLWKRDKKTGTLAVGLLLAFCIGLFLMVPISDFVWKTLTLLQNFQFPWRFLSLTVFITAVLGGFLTVLIPKRFIIITVGWLVFLLLVSSKSHWHAKDYIVRDESFYTGIYNGTTDTGESAPIWSVRFMEKRAAAPREVVLGSATITNEKRSSIVHEYKIVADSKARVRENTLYFPGWQVYVDGVSVPLEFQDPRHRGLMTFFVEKGSHDVSVRFSETRLRFVADIVSVISFIALFVMIGVGKRLWVRFR